MKEAEVIIDEQACTGCGYCGLFCPKQCIVFSGEKLGSLGQHLPDLSNMEECTACGICARMCPAFAVEVFRLKPDKKS